MVNEISQAAIGRALRLSPSAITKLKQQGMPVTSIEAAQAWREERQNIAARKALPGAAVLSPQRPPAFCPPPDFPDDAVTDENHDSARTRLRIAEANMAEMAEAKMRRELVNLTVVEKQLATDYATTRDALLQIPARLAPLLSPETDTTTIYNLLHAEIHQALLNLAGTVQQVRGTPEAFE